MKIITLIENLKNENSNLENEHGISLYIELGDKKILFDVGKTDKFIRNAKKMGVILSDVDIVVISHGHKDHGGGLSEFFKINKKAKVFMKEEVQGEKIFKYFFISRSIGLDSDCFIKNKDRINFISKFSEIENNIFLITDIERKYSVPNGNKYLYLKFKNKMKQDNFNHELIMVLKENNKINVFTGCSHNGIENMIDSVRDKFSKEKIQMLIGGFHLLKLPIFGIYTQEDTIIERISRKILDEKIEKVFTGHCTGEKGYEKLRKILGEKIKYFKTGDELN
ncbi:MAG: MBL fold metallo-hydrolase [Fusobacteriaceae bacterium]